MQNTKYSDKYFLMEISELAESFPELKPKIERYERLVREINIIYTNHKSSGFFCRKIEIETLYEKLSNFLKNRTFDL